MSLNPLCAPMPPFNPCSPSPPSGDLSDLLKVELKDGTWLALKDFETSTGLDSALALVEHLTEG